MTPARRTTTFISALLAAGLLLGAAACTEDDPTDSARSDGRGVLLEDDADEPDPDDVRAVGTDLDEAMALLVQHSNGPVGAISVIDVDGEVAVHSAGSVEWGSTTKPTADDHVRAASLSKAMTGATALSLIDDGEMSWDDTVGELLPDTPAAWHEVTLRELLTHTSGVADYPRQEAFGEAINASPDVALAPAAIMALAGDAMQFEPGERFLYTNTNPLITALMIEAATGESFDDNLATHVLDPLDMTDTYVPAPDDAAIRTPALHGYATAGDGSVEDVTDSAAWGGWAWASGGIVSTPSDLSRFIRGYVGGKLFGPEVVAEQRRYAFPGSSEPMGPGDNGAGPAQFRYDTSCGTVYGHTGSIMGYSQFIAASADGSRSVTFTISTQVDDELLPTLRAVQELAVCEALGG